MSGDPRRWARVENAASGRWLESRPVTMRGKGHAARSGRTSLYLTEEVLIRRLLAGERVVDIAESMDVPPATVYGYLASARRVVGVSTKAELLEWARARPEFTGEGL